MSLTSYLDEIAEVAAAGGRLEDVLKSIALRMRGVDPTDWRMRHRPPANIEEGAQLSRMYNIYPEDVYTNPRIYASEADELAVAPIMRRVRDQDELLIDIYRATPRWISDIESGDWVTPSLGYAQRHADIIRRPDVPTVILAGKAPAGSLLSEGNSLAEFGFIGDPIRPAARLGSPRIPATLVERAKAGDITAIQRLAKLYGLEQLAGGAR